MFKPKMNLLSAPIKMQINEYFEDSKRALFRNFVYLFDPKSFRVYATINDAAGHGMIGPRGQTKLDKFINYFKFKQSKVGPRSESVRRYENKALDVNRFRIEYENLKLLLFRNKDIYPLDMTARLKYIVLKIEETQNMYSNVFPILQTIMICFSGVIDIERQNGTKKLICTANRDNMKNETLDIEDILQFSGPRGRRHTEQVAVGSCQSVSASRIQLECEELDDMVLNE